MYLVARRREMFRDLLIDLMHVFFFVGLVGILLVVRRHVGRAMRMDFSQDGLSVPRRYGPRGGMDD